MLRSRFIDTLRAYGNAKKYSSLLTGVEVSLPTGDRMELRVSRIEPIRAVDLFRIYPYAYAAEITAGGIREMGYAEAHLPLLGVQKCISEAVERCLFRALKGTSYGTTTSNGWAAHVSLEKAKSSALFELLERDAVLTHSLQEIPFLEIDPSTLPKWLLGWSQRELAATEYSRLRVLISTRGHVPSLSVAFTNQDGYGVIAHAADVDQERALMRALAEACRIGRMALSGNFREGSADLFAADPLVPASGPCEQAVAYAHNRPFPSWMFGDAVGWAQARAGWGRRVAAFNANPIAYEFIPVLQSPIAAGYCRSAEVQNLFFGRTIDAERRGELNRVRLERAKPTGELSLLPHFVA